jgi:hypothetical protein
MGSPLSPLIATLFMEDCEELAFGWATYKPIYWSHYVDDTFIWLHRPEESHDLHTHFFNIHPKIQFITDAESNDLLTFLDIEMY